MQRLRYEKRGAINFSIASKAYGMRAAFIDRRQRPFGETPYLPDLIVADFAGLAAALA